MRKQNQHESTTQESNPLFPAKASRIWPRSTHRGRWLPIRPRRLAGSARDGSSQTKQGTKDARIAEAAIRGAEARAGKPLPALALPSPRSWLPGRQCSGRRTLPIREAPLKAGTKPARIVDATIRLTKARGGKPLRAFALTSPRSWLPARQCSRRRTFPIREAPLKAGTKPARIIDAPIRSTKAFASNPLRVAVYPCPRSWLLGRQRTRRHTLPIREAPLKAGTRPARIAGAPIRLIKARGGKPLRAFALTSSRSWLPARQCSRRRALPIREVLLKAGTKPARIADAPIRFAEAFVSKPLHAPVCPCPRSWLLGRQRSRRHAVPIREAAPKAGTKPARIIDAAIRSNRPRAGFVRRVRGRAAPKRRERESRRAARKRP